MLNEIKETDVIIYLVDDDELLLRIFKTKFQNSFEFQVYTFTTGEDFLEELLNKTMSKRYQRIVLLDYFLKTKENQEAKNGVDILKVVKEIHPEIDVIMLSGVDDVDITSNSMRYGAHSFIKKNENAFMRITNNIKWILSEKNLKRKQKSTKFYIRIFLIVAAILVLFVAYYLIRDSFE